MRARKLTSEVRQEQIAEAALALVAAQGMKALSVARVARRVGVVPSAIYRHYRSKDDVLDAVLSMIRSRLLLNVEAVCSESNDPLERLQLLLRHHIKLLRDNEGIPRVVFSQELHHGDTQRKTRTYGIIREYLDRVAEIVRDGQQKGQIRSEFRPEAIAMMYLGIVQPAALLWDFSGGDFDVTRHGDHAWQILNAAIRSDDISEASSARRSKGTKRKEQRDE